MRLRPQVAPRFSALPVLVKPRGLAGHGSGDQAKVAEERDELGRGTGKQGDWAREEEPRAARQEGDPHALDVEGDPRGGVQSDEYRHADPRDVVQEGNVAMSGPGGAPQEELSVEERRRRSADMRERAVHRPPDPET